MCHNSDLIARFSSQRIGFISTVVPVGFVVEKKGLEQVFHRVLWFSPSNDRFVKASLSHLQSGAATIGPFMAAVQREAVSSHPNNNKLTKLRGRSPQANYTDRTIAACRRS
jgi:hypothetical protein